MKGITEKRDNILNIVRHCMTTKNITFISYYADKRKTVGIDGRAMKWFGLRGNIGRGLEDFCDFLNVFLPKEFHASITRPHYSWAHSLVINEIK